MKLKTSVYMLFGAGLAALSLQANATIVQVQTNMGNFEINLFDETTPETVKNFLRYVENGRYDNTVIHRSEPGFVVQGGGFRFQNALPLVAVPTYSSVVNEPKLSNVKGTVAMAKISQQPNSATNQWFVNLVNNSSNLDRQNSGFTVFGQINAQGMEIIDAMAKLNRYTFPGISGLPLRNYTNSDRDDNKPLVADNLITIEKIIVIDDRANTSAGLNPTPNTLINDNSGSNDSGSSGGSFGTFMLACAGLLLWCRRKPA